MIRLICSQYVSKQNVALVGVERDLSRKFMSLIMRCGSIYSFAAGLVLDYYIWVVLYGEDVHRHANLY